jgi:hypothetical protein
MTPGLAALQQVREMAHAAVAIHNARRRIPHCRIRQSLYHASDFFGEPQSVAGVGAGSIRIVLMLGGMMRIQKLPARVVVRKPAASQNNATTRDHPSLARRLLQ